jgi:hypothetical protein
VWRVFGTADGVFYFGYCSAQVGFSAVGLQIRIEVGAVWLNFVAVPYIFCCMLF